MVDQKIGPRQLSQKVSVVITKCGRFWYYKLRQLLLQIAAANSLQNGNLYYKKGTGISIRGFYYTTVYSSIFDNFENIF